MPFLFLHNNLKNLASPNSGARFHFYFVIKFDLGVWTKGAFKFDLLGHFLRVSRTCIWVTGFPDKHATSGLVLKLSPNYFWSIYS